MRWLRQIKGIGEWSAHFILLRGLGRMEGIPAGDKWLTEAVSQFYGPASLFLLSARRLERDWT